MMFRRLAKWVLGPICFMVFCWGAQPSLVQAEDARTSISPNAQAAMDRGLAAAKQKKWDLAIKHFSEAQKEAPANPEALFNLALAYDSAKGRELLALCWFYAYLEAAPDAPNAEQVRKRIPELEITVEDNLRKLAHTIREATEKMPKGAYIIAGQDRSELKEGDVIGSAATQAHIGEYERAFQIAETLKGLSRRQAYEAIAVVRAGFGEIEGVEVALKNISAADVPDEDKKSWEDRVRQLRQTAQESKANGKKESWLDIASDISAWASTGRAVGMSASASENWMIWLMAGHVACENLDEFLDFAKKASPLRALHAMRGAVTSMSAFLHRIQNKKRQSAAAGQSAP